jgi:adenylate cyclase
VLRSQVIAAFENAGITLEQLRSGISEGTMTLDYIDLFYPDPGPRSGHTYAEFEASLGSRARLLAPALTALGLPRPPASTPMRVPAEQALRDFLEAWDVSADDEVVTRAARLAGEGVRAVAEGWVRLFYEAVSRPLQDEGLGLDVLIERSVRRAVRLAEIAPEMVTWLLQRHMQRAIDELNVEDIERELARRGERPPTPRQAPAVAFVDLSDYTRLTQEQGDESAARAAARLARLADEAATRHDGRVVKLLGDGVLMTFARSVDAVLAAVEVAANAPARGLPPVHAGVAAGPLISRDGDVYGNTVNLAARVAASAEASQILDTEAVVEAVVAAGADGVAGVTFTPLGAVELKGVAGPVTVAAVLPET